MNSTIEEFKQVAAKEGKLLAIKQISEWLRTQPSSINKEDLIQYLLINVGATNDQLPA